ncbi:DNA-binding transcriptional LysR family regulator [Sporomusaceae bacterium BoRhaA]|uniref:LysR family transcriptional regulator n=1 Tax=Pelorhabdus rhamnosifermentans TaxID=2772457 RepID=UPI001C061D6E|nr:LysR family transcriptional regulator [Pelorhabdus rhamnosifermentans]MBU2703488.1 DNA-binding transcriptional LysR family regulator [Pelorhabdus rhamnosifermentans]
MDLRQLRTFLCIAKMGSFIQAATHLGYTPSTVTTHIKNLESHLGIKLFDRLGHKINLTSEGRTFKTYAEKIIKLADEAKEAVTPSSTPHGTIILGTAESLSTYRIPTLLQTYRHEYDKVELVLKFENCSKIRDCIRNNELDIALIINRKIEEPDFIVKCLSLEPMLFITAPNHPFAKKIISPQNLSETCLILTEPGCSYRATIETLLDKANVRPRTSMEVNSIESIKQLVMLGLGISMLPRFTVEKELQNNQLAVAEPHLPLPLYMTQLIYHKNKWLSPALRAFIKTVDQTFINSYF